MDELLFEIQPTTPQYTHAFIGMHLSLYSNNLVKLMLANK